MNAKIVFHLEELKKDASFDDYFSSSFQSDLEAL